LAGCTAPALGCSARVLARTLTNCDPDGPTQIERRRRRERWLVARAQRRKSRGRAVGGARGQNGWKQGATGSKEPAAARMPSSPAAGRSLRVPAHTRGGRDGRRPGFGDDDRAHRAWWIRAGRTAARRGRRARRKPCPAAGAEARDGGRAHRASLGPCRETEGTGAGEGARSR